MTTDKIDRFLEYKAPPTPCLVVDVDRVAENYQALQSALPIADIFYAVKANPAPQILSKLRDLGSSFDAASIHEIERCLDVGIDPAVLSFGNTIKKERDIARAAEMGVALYAFDSAAELDKLVRAAPGARVYCRILMEGEGADWPLSDKFGCELAMAEDLMVEAGERGLDPFGISFHVGSQQRQLAQWDVGLGRAAMVFSNLQRRGVDLRMVNIGGGFPAQYRHDIAPVSAYGDTIRDAIHRHFGNRRPQIIVEPGRGIVGDAGVIRAEVVLISQKTRADDTRWVYLDIGKFGGLPEVMDEAIQYRLRTAKDGGAMLPVVIAGPTCDEVDMLYEEADYRLPADLEIGDHVDVLSAGAYTATYSSVGFNGFPPLREYYI